MLLASALFVSLTRSNRSQPFRAHIRSGPENEVLPVLEELGIGLVLFSPLGKDFLTGTITADTKFSETDMRGKVSRFEAEHRAANQRIVDLIRSIADAHPATPVQVGLAWLLAHRPWIVPLFGTRSMTRFDENLGAIDIHLSVKELQALNDSKNTMPVEGEQIPR